MSQPPPLTTGPEINAPGATDQSQTQPIGRVAAALHGRDVACPGCGYNLRNLSEGKCPECGALFSEEDLERMAQAAAGSLGLLAFLRQNRLGPSAVLAALWTFTPAICGILLLTYIETVSGWLRAQGSSGLVIYIGVFVVAAGLGMLPTVSQAVLGGWCFGFAYGYPAALLGFTGAAIVGYVVARTVARDRVEHVIETNRKARAMRDALIGHGFWKTLGLVTLVRLPPNSPFALTNLALSSTGVPPAAFAVGTMLGMAPRTAVAVFVGSNIEQLTRESLTADPGKYVMLGISLALFLVIGWIGKQTWDRVTGPQNAPAH